MLRNAVVGFFAAALVILVAVAAAGLASWGPAIGCFIVLALLLFERQRYAGQPTGDRLQPLTPTGERFIDPESGRPIQVWMNARGERQYIEEPPARDHA
jgi:hypothetical protein